MSNRHIGLIAILFSIAGYAILPILTRTVYNLSELQPTDLAIWRFVFATPAIWLVIWMRENIGDKKPKKPDSRAQIGRMLAIGLLYTAATLSAFFGLKYVPASLYIVIFYTYPMLVAVIGIFMGRKLQPVAWVAIVLTIIGVILTVPDLRLAGENTALGLGIAVINAIVVAIYFIIVSREMPKMSSVSRGVAYIITGTLIILLCLIPIFGFRLPENLFIWGLVILMATWSTAMPIFLINIAIQNLGVTETAVMSTSEPIATMILAMILLGEQIILVQWIGALVIITGVILLELRGSKHPLDIA